MLTLHVRTIFADPEGKDVHWYCQREGEPTKVGALYWLPPDISDVELLNRVLTQLNQLNQLNGLTRSAGGGEEENPDIREAEKVPTSNPSSSSASGADA